MAAQSRQPYSSKWAVALFAAALLLVILVGMIRELMERLSPGEVLKLDGG